MFGQLGCCDAWEGGYFAAEFMVPQYDLCACSRYGHERDIAATVMGLKSRDWDVTSWGRKRLNSKFYDQEDLCIE